MSSSVGFIVVMPRGQVLHAHLSGPTRPALLDKYEFPAGSHGAICGGDNSQSSNCTMFRIIAWFAMKGIKLDGLINFTGCFVDKDGEYYIRENTKDYPTVSPNDPKCTD